MKAYCGKLPPLIGPMFKNITMFYLFARSGRWVDRSKGLDGGKFKKGVRKVKRKDVAKFKKSKT